MTSTHRIQRALVSLSEKRDLTTLVDLLRAWKVEVISTGGTLAALREQGLAPVAVAEYTGFPEILEGRVKTLHPRVHGGILARPIASHRAELEQHDILDIDLVVVNLYPFAKTIEDPQCSLVQAIENIDIGGPTMIRAAAKNWERVTCVVDPGDYGRLARVLHEHDGGVPEELRFELARKAFAHTAAYDAAIARYLWSRPLCDEPRSGSNPVPRSVPSMPPVFVAGGPVATILRYGENPHQAAAVYPVLQGAPGVAQAKQHQGKALSYNNLVDADAGMELVRDLAALGCAAAVIKHATPCGVAVDPEPRATLSEVFERARSADAESAFGGIVALSRVVDEETAERLTDTFLEVVIAPDYTPEALRKLASKPNVRVLECPEMLSDAEPSRVVRSITGSLLVQDTDPRPIDLVALDSASSSRPSNQELRDLEVAWRTAKHVRSNAVVVCKNGVTLAIGGGQTSRVEAVRQAVARAGTEISGAVVASDGFFPFRDSIDVLAAHGVRAVVQPGGSLRDQEVVAAANEHGIAMLMTGERHFRH